MAKKKKHKPQPPTEYVEVEVNHGMFEDYLQYGPQYDTVNECPIFEGETEFVAWQSFKKQPKDVKELLKDIMVNFVTDYWQTCRQIPVDGDLKQLRKNALDALLHDLRIYLKDDKEVTQFLNGCVSTTINRLLKAEKASNNV